MQVNIRQYGITGNIKPSDMMVHAVNAVQFCYCM